MSTIGSANFARFAVQVALQHEIDLRELSDNYTTSYIPLGSTVPDEYPTGLYGTEVFELNDALRKLAVGFARNATLADSPAAVAYRALYASEPTYAAGAAPPAIVECDVATSDVYYSGKLLSDAFKNFTTLITSKRSPPRLRHCSC